MGYIKSKFVTLKISVDRTLLITLHICSNVINYESFSYFLDFEKHL